MFSWLVLSDSATPVDYRSPHFPVLYYLPEFAQTHVHWVSDAIQRPHPLSSPSPPAFNLSQHRNLFQWVGSLHQVAKVCLISIVCLSVYLHIYVCLSIHHLSLYRYLCVCTYPAIYLASICLCICSNLSPMYTSLCLGMYTSLCLIICLSLLRWMSRYVKGFCFIPWHQGDSSTWQVRALGSLDSHLYLLKPSQDKYSKSPPWLVPSVTCISSESSLHTIDLKEGLSPHDWVVPV